MCHLFVNAMTTVSAVVFSYSPHTTLASAAVLNMDDAGDIAPAAAMGMMICYTAAGVKILMNKGFDFFDQCAKTHFKTLHDITRRAPTL